MWVDFYMMFLVFGIGFLGGAATVLPFWLSEMRRNAKVRY